MDGDVNEIDVLRRQLEAQEESISETKKRLDDLKEIRETQRLRQEEEERKRLKETEEREKRQKEEEEGRELNDAIRRLAIQQLKLDEIRRAKEAAGAILDKRQSELEAIRDIVSYRDRRYRQLLTGAVTNNESNDLKTLDNGSGAVNHFEDREQIFQDVLDQHQTKYETRIGGLSEKEKELKEKKRRMGRRQLQHHNPFPLSSEIVERVTSELPGDRKKLEQLRKEVLDWQERKAYRGGILDYDGQLGIESYQDWQLQDYHMVRALLLELVDAAVDEAADVSAGSIDFETQQVIWELQKRQLEEEKKAHARHKEAQLISFEITEDVISLVAEELVEEVVNIFKATKEMVSSLFIKIVENAAGNQTSNHLERHQLLENSYQEMKKTRGKRHEVYRHSLTSWTGRGGQLQAQMPSSEVDDEDVTTINFLDIESNGSRLLTEGMEEYVEAEMNYWENSRPSVSVTQLSDNVKGISVVKTNCSGRYLALGTHSGDIYILDLYFSPAWILRFQIGHNQGKASVIHIAWSLDSTRILSIDSLGFLQLWSLAHTDILPLKKDTTGHPSPLKSLVLLSPEELGFVQGPFSGMAPRSDGTPLPVLGNFWPTVSLLGTQNQLVVAMDTGDIVKINSSDLLIPINAAPQQGSTNKIGKNLQAELFRGHRSNVLLLEFLCETNEMISLDATGFLMCWKQEKSFRTGYGWFIPSRKYRIDMSERVYKPSYGSAPRIEFSDVRKLAGKKKQTLQQLAARRAQAMAAIKAEDLSVQPWHSSKTREFVVHVYAPCIVPDSGKTFHIVTYHQSNGELSEYATQTYKPAKSPAEKMLDCHLNPSTQHLTIMFLFPGYSPKAPHVSIVTLNLHSIAFYPTQIDIPLSERQYTDCLSSQECSFQVSNVLSLTLSDYVFVNAFGALQAYSMVSGNLVLCNREVTGEELWVRGCVLNHRQSSLQKASLLSLAYHNGGIIVVSCAKSSSVVKVLQLEDINRVEGRLSMWEATDHGTLDCLRKCPLELQVKSQHWALDGSVFANPWDFCHQLVNEIIECVSAAEEDSNENESEIDRLETREASERLAVPSRVSQTGSGSDSQIVD